MEKEYVKGLGNVYTFQKSFDEALVLLKQNNANLISLRDLAYTRRTNGEDSDLSQCGFYTRESPIYSKDVSLLVLNSPLQNIQLAKEAVQANKQGNYFQLKDKELFNKSLSQAEEDLKKEPEKREVLFLPSDNLFNISRNENFEFARGLLKDQAEPYLEFLERSKQGINSIKFYPVSKEEINNSENPILTELWLCRLYGSDRSVLNGYGIYLYDNYRVCGWSGSDEATKPVKIF